MVYISSRKINYSLEGLRAKLSQRLEERWSKTRLKHSDQTLRRQRMIIENAWVRLVILRGSEKRLTSELKTHKQKHILTVSEVTIKDKKFF